jgi:hypothetical protein
MDEIVKRVKYSHRVLIRPSMRRMEVIAVLGDFIIVTILVGSISTGLIRITDITSAIAYVLVIAIVSLSVWGFRGRIEKTSPKEISFHANKAKPLMEKKGPFIINSGAKAEKLAFDETKIIRSGEYQYYPLSLIRGDRVTGSVSSYEPIDFYVMTVENLEKLEKGKNFVAEEASTGIKRVAFDFQCPKRGLWEIVLENPGERDAEVTVLIRILSVTRVMRGAG